MSMTVVVTRDVPPRTRGFLASTMLELAPGVYTAARLSVAVRERIWNVVANWYQAEPRGTIIMLWGDNTLPCGQSVRSLGLPPVDLVELDGIVLSRKPHESSTASTHAL